MMDNDRIHAITQSAIALIVVLGGGFYMFFSTTTEAITAVSGLVGVVIAYYFNQVSNQRQFNQTMQAIERGKKDGS